MSTLLDTQVEALGWTLLHSLWQGAALWMALEAALAWPGLKSPRVRGRLAGGALLLFVLAVAGTYGWVGREDFAGDRGGAGGGGGGGAFRVGGRGGG